MRVEQQTFRPPKQLLECQLCNQIYYKPITLSCGHTFCRDCLRERTRSNGNRKSEESMIGYKEKESGVGRAKLSICSICQSIIWKGVPQMKQNLAIQNLISKFYPAELRSRVPTSSVDSPIVPVHQPSQFNKIVLTISEPSSIPMPSCYSDIEFTTAFIDDVVSQSQSIVITWKTLEEKSLGLLSKLKKVEPVQPHSTFNRIVFNVQQSSQVLELKYKANIEGISFVKLEDRELIGINLRHKLIILGQQGVDKVIKHLQICNCHPHESANTSNLSPQHFSLFFSLYDNMNNPHYIKQIRSLLSDEPFQSRNNPQLMLYCILRLIKISEEDRKKLVLCFDDETRIREINHWLLGSRNRMIDQVIHVKVPGKYNTGVVFFIIFILLAFNLFQDYGNKIM